MSVRRMAITAGGMVIGGLGVLHLAWGAGSSFPAPDRRRLSEVVAGTDAVPGVVPCVTMAAGLGGAAAIVLGIGGRRPVARVARSAIAVGFAVRGVAGLTGRTHHLVPWTPDAAFVRIDRRYYGPLCLAIAASAVVAAA